MTIIDGDNERYDDPLGPGSSYTRVTPDPDRRERAQHRQAFGAGPAAGEHVHIHIDDEVPAEVRKKLTPAERHAYVMHFHPAALAGPCAILAAALAVAIAINAYALQKQQATPILIHTVWIGFLLVAAWYGWRALQWYRTWFVITPKRMMRISGWPAQQTVSLPWRRCRDLELIQPATGRWLGYGTLVAPSAATGHALGQVAYVPRVDYVYNVIWQLLEPERGPSPMPEEVE